MFFIKVVLIVLVVSEFGLVIWCLNSLVMVFSMLILLSRLLKLRLKMIIVIDLSMDDILLWLRIVLIKFMLDLIL